MNKKKAAIFLALALVCTTFLGCATVPKEELDEKEAVIGNLNVQIDGLKQQVEKLQRTNEQLMGERSDLEEKIARLEKKLAEKQKAAEKRAEPTVK